MKSYRPRIADQELTRRLTSMGAVLIEGPKACGKTASASQVAKTIFRLDQDDQARAAVALAPDRLFAGQTPILFDEWQTEPALWNRVRGQVDDRQAHGLFILTGSATPKDDVNRHSGAGRIGLLQMRPMSLFESGHSTGAISLRAIFDGDAPTAKSPELSFEELLSRIVIGGWPALLDATEAQARDWLTDYLTQLTEVDVLALGTRRSPRNLRRLLAALARSVGQPAKATELAKDVGGADGPMAAQTLSSYLDALGRLHLTEDAQSWQPHMRSRARLRSSPIRYFVDPSLGPAALGVGSADLASDLNAAGFHFEALVMRDLRIYGQPLRGTVEAWRDSNGNEVDAVVSLDDGRWGAFEIKLNPTAVETASASLLRFVNSVDTTKHGAPAVIAVITSSGFAGRRPDGVQVVPITTLGP